MPQTTPNVPDRPTLDGIDVVWADRWEKSGIYRFRAPGARSAVFSIDTPPPTVSGSLHVGHVFSYTHTDIVARFQRMRGKHVFYPMGWDDNGLPTERRVQNHFGVRVESGQITRDDFIGLCETLTAEDEQAFERLWRRLGLSVDWSLTYSTIGERARRVSQLGFLRLLRADEAYQAEAPVLWDVGFQTAVAQAELEDREVAGAWYGINFRGPSGPVLIETTRPELLPACVALIAHPDDPRYQELFGSTVSSPVFGAAVPVLAHPAAEPDRGTGIAMCCTFGDLTDVQWWRELRLPAAAIIGRDGRLLPDPPSGLSEPGRAAYSSLAGLRVRAARSRVAELLTESGDLVGEPRPTVRPVKFYEKGDQPLEIISSRQWFIRSLRYQDALLRRGAELRWHPEYMKVRYDDWVRGLTSDWLISRQRFFGVPFPVWYPLDDLGSPVYAAPILPSSDSDLPVDPQSAPAPGYSPAQRDVPGGFTGDPDVMDTWATSSLTPEIVCGWESDPELFAQTFPMDLRPQSHEIIRTWLFSTVLRSDLLFGSVPWRDVAISGWILDPDRKKMSKSKGNVVTPIDLLERFGSDGVRYWAASGRPGTDTAFDEGQMRVGRRLATKLLNASRFVLGFGSPPASSEVSAPSSPLDLAMLAALDSVVASATAALSDLEYTAALEVTERFFWSFCDDYLELVKQRAYAGDGSARLALQSALSVLQRLFAPFLPFCTEEAWSWWNDDSVHTSPWPEPAGWAGDPDLLAAASTVMAAIRKAKSSAKRSMREPADVVLVRGPAAVIEALRSAAADIRAAGNVTSLVLEPSDDPNLTVEVRLGPVAQGHR